MQEVIEALEEYKKEVLMMTEKNRKDIFTLRDAMKELTAACVEMDNRIQELEQINMVPERTLTLDGDQDV